MHLEYEERWSAVSYYRISISTNTYTDHFVIVNRKTKRDLELEKAHIEVDQLKQLINALREQMKSAPKANLRTSCRCSKDPLPTKTIDQGAPASDQGVSFSAQHLPHFYHDDGDSSSEGDEEYSPVANEDGNEQCPSPISPRKSTSFGYPSFRVPPILPESHLHYHPPSPPSSAASPTNSHTSSIFEELPNGTYTVGEVLQNLEEEEMDGTQASRRQAMGELVAPADYYRSMEMENHIGRYGGKVGYWAY